MSSSGTWLAEAKSITKAMKCHCETEAERAKLLNMYLPMLVAEAEKIRQINAIINPPDDNYF